MIDLTTLSKKELIKEFNVIISEWQKCKQQIDAYEYEIQESKKRRWRIESDIKKSIKFNTRSRKVDENCKTFAELPDFVSKKIGVALVWIFIVIIAGVIGIKINMFTRSRTDIINLNMFLIKIAIILIIGWFSCIYICAKMEKKYNRKSENLREELNLLLGQNKEYSEVGIKIESLQKKIQQVNKNFSKFRKRNNLASKYYGYEYTLKGYLENGTADSLKEAILRLEEDIHRNKMLNVQENMRAQINGMRNQVSRQLALQSKQLANQSSEINHLSREVSYLSNEY